MTTRSIPSRGGRTCAALVACMLLACAGAASAAPPWPARPITLYVAFGPGGAGDLVARAVSREMTQSLRQPVVVDNRPAPLVAEVQVARAKPDGYSLLVSGNGNAVSAAIFKSLPYDVMKDLTHVSTLAALELALLTTADSPLRTAADLIAWARAHPGQLNIGTQHVGSTQNLTAELFKSAAGIDAVIIPYRTAADLVTALRTKDVQVAFEIVSPVLAQIASRVLRPLAVTSTQRFAGMADVPTVAETLPGFDATGWLGISVPAGTPQPIVEALNREIRAAVGKPSVQTALRDAGAVPMSSTPGEITQRMRGDIVKWRGVVDKAGIARQ